MKVDDYFEIQCVMGDILAQKADVLTNSAGPNLRHIKGLAKLISDGAGPKLQTYCNEQIA